EVGALRFDPIVLRGQAARRTARHFGLGYDYEARTPRAGEPVPAWLVPLRERAAEIARREAEELVEVLVQRYPPGATIGWHRDAPAGSAEPAPRDAPAFGIVVGVSLGGSSRLRFQRGKGEERRVWEVM